MKYFKSLRNLKNLNQYDPEDFTETDRVECHICGKQLESWNYHSCPECGEPVCDAHYERMERKNV